MCIHACQPLIDASSFIESEATTGRNSTFYEELSFNRYIAANLGIDAALEAYKLDALVLPVPGMVSALPAGMLSI